MNELLARLTAMPSADLRVAGTDYLDGADDVSEPIDELRMPNGEALQSIGGDSSGGVYFLVGEGGDERPLLYVDSEGRAGLIGADLAVGLELLIGLPNWSDFRSRERRGWDARQVADWDEQ